MFRLKLRVTCAVALIVTLIVVSASAQILPKPPIRPPDPTKGDPITQGKESLKDAEKDVERIKDRIKNLDPREAPAEVWGEAGRVGFVAAAKTMAKRSPTGEPMPDTYKEALKRHFPGLVNRVTLHWGTTGLDEWSAERFNIRLTKDDSEAQTYGHDIYIRSKNGEKPSDDTLALLAHELVHSRQFEQLGNSYSEFGYHYFKEYKKAGESYEGNKLEAEAFRTAASIMASLTPSGLEGKTKEQLKNALESLSRDQLAAVIGKLDGQTLKNGLEVIDGRTLQVAVDVMDVETLASGMRRVDGETLTAILKRVHPNRRERVLPMLDDTTRRAAERRKKHWRG